MRNIAFADIEMAPVKDGVENCKENVKVFQQIQIWIWCSIESLDLSVEKIKGSRKKMDLIKKRIPGKDAKKIEKIQGGNREVQGAFMERILYLV